MVSEGVWPRVQPPGISLGEASKFAISEQSHQGARDMQMKLQIREAPNRLWKELRGLRLAGCAGGGVNGIRGDIAMEETKGR